MMKACCVKYYAIWVGVWPFGLAIATILWRQEYFIMGLLGRFGVAKTVCSLFGNIPVKRHRMHGYETFQLKIFNS